MFSLLTSTAWIGVGVATVLQATVGKPTDVRAILRQVVEAVEDIRREHALGRFPDLAELGDFVVELSRKKSVSGQVFNFESRII